VLRCEISPLVSYEGEDLEGQFPVPLDLPFHLQSIKETGMPHLDHQISIADTDTRVTNPDAYEGVRAARPTRAITIVSPVRPAAPESASTAAGGGAAADDNSKIPTVRLIGPSDAGEEESGGSGGPASVRGTRKALTIVEGKGAGVAVN